MCGFPNDMTVVASGDTLLTPGISYSSFTQTSSSSNPTTLDSLGLNLGFETWPFGTTFNNYRGSSSGKIFNEWLFILDAIQTPSSFLTSGVNVSRESVIVNSGTYSLHVNIFDNGNAAELEIEQSATLNGGLGINYAPAVGKKIQLSFAALCSSSNTVLGELSIGNASTNFGTVTTPFHPGDGQWHILKTPTIFVPSLPTIFTIDIGIAGSVPLGDYYFDSCHLISPVSVLSYVEPNVISGCPNCGTFNQRGELVGVPFDSGVDITNR